MKLLTNMKLVMNTKHSRKMRTIQTWNSVWSRRIVLTWNLVWTRRIVRKWNSVWTWRTYEQEIWFEHKASWTTTTKDRTNAEDRANMKDRICNCPASSISLPHFHCQVWQTTLTFTEKSLLTVWIGHIIWAIMIFMSDFKVLSTSWYFNENRNWSNVVSWIFVWGEGGFLKARADDCNITVPFLLVHNGMADKRNICCVTSEWCFHILIFIVLNIQPRQPSPLTDQKQLENVEYFNYLGSMITTCGHWSITWHRRKGISYCSARLVVCLFLTNLILWAPDSIERGGSHYLVPTCFGLKLVLPPCQCITDSHLCSNNLNLF